jgi:hypothetical protein
MGNLSQKRQYHRWLDMSVGQLVSWVKKVSSSCGTYREHRCDNIRNQYSISDLSWVERVALA